MAIEQRGDSYRAKVFDGKILVVQKTFQSRAEAETFEKVEKAKLVIQNHATVARLSEVARELGPMEVPTGVQLAWIAKWYEANGMLGTHSSAHTRSGTSTTLKEIVERYLKEVSPKKKGHAQEKRRLSLFLQHPIAAKPVIGAKKDFQKYRDERLKVVSPATVVRELGSWHAIIEHAREEWDLDIPENPAAVKHPEGANEQRDRRLEPGEEEKLLAISDELLRDAIMCAIDTTLARGEIVKLTRNHLKQMGGNAYIELPKGYAKNRRDRRIPLTVRCRDMLARRAEANPDKLFPIVTADALTTRFNKLCRKLKIEDLTFHDFRHEGTSRFCEMKLYIQAELMEITGHSSVTTFKRYMKTQGAELAARMRG